MVRGAVRLAGAPVGAKQNRKSHTGFTQASSIAQLTSLSRIDKEESCEWSHSNSVERCKSASVGVVGMKRANIDVVLYSMERPVCVGDDLCDLHQVE